MAVTPVPIRVGTAGWSYEDWKGIVYPKTPSRGFDLLGELASLFDTNEINSSFYRIPTARAAAGWARRVAHNPRFAFTAKLYRGFTHERTSGAPEEKAFLEAMDPLASDGRLGAVLVQFPVSFHDTPANRLILATLLDRFAALPLAAEFRHASWNNAGVLALLAERNAAFVNIDQPWLSGNLRATDHVAAGRAYFRFHGRNAEKWFGPDTSNEERYNYLYSEKELRPAADRIARAAATAAEADGGKNHLAPGSGVSAILNNHFRGQAVANALQLQYLLTGEVVAAPESLRAVYSALGSITESQPDLSPGGQASLFRTPSEGAP